MSNDLGDGYPNLNHIVFERCWIEIGFDEYSQSFICALDHGGMVWEGRQFYDSLAEAMTDLERGLAQWMQE